MNTQEAILKVLAFSDGFSSLNETLLTEVRTKTGKCSESELRTALESLREAGRLSFKIFKNPESQWWELKNPLVERLNQENLFDKYFSWWNESRPSYTKRNEWLEKRGIPSENELLVELHESIEAEDWLVRKAIDARSALDAHLPRYLDEKVRFALLDQKFSEVMGAIDNRGKRYNLEASLAKA
jgi:hypothetical protein